MKNILITIIWVCLATAVLAQDGEKKCRLETHFFNHTTFSLYQSANRDFFSADGRLFQPYYINTFNFGLQNTCGVEVNERYSAGFVTGIKSISQNSLLQLSADLKYYPLKSQFRPYLLFNAGYDIGLTQYFNSKTLGGYSLSAGIGILNMFNSKTGFSFSLAYLKQQVINRDTQTSGDIYDYVNFFNLITAGIGVYFR